MTLAPELERIRKEVEATNAKAVVLCRGLEGEQLAWRERPGRWSIAEILLHLEITTHVCLPSVDQAIDEARRKKLHGAGPFNIGMMGRLFVWYVEPPPAIKLPSPRVLIPMLQGPADEVLPRFLRSQQLMLQRLEAANGIHLTRARFISPFASFVRMNLLALFSVFTAHERRHLWQASNLRQQLEARLKAAV